MKPECEKCGAIIPGKIKLHTYKKKIGKKAKDVVEYYCETCFKTVEQERSWDVHRKQKAVLKKQNIRRLQRRKKKVR